MNACAGACLVTPSAAGHVFHASGTLVAGCTTWSAMDVQQKLQYSALQKVLDRLLQWVTRVLVARRSIRLSNQASQQSMSKLKAMKITYKHIALSTEVANIYSALHAIYDTSCSGWQVVEGSQMAALRL